VGQVWIGIVVVVVGGGSVVVVVGLGGGDVVAVVAGAGTVVAGGRVVAVLLDLFFAVARAVVGVVGTTAGAVVGGSVGTENCEPNSVVVVARSVVDVDVESLGTRDGRSGLWSGMSR
jgi:hypothetical protein